MDRNRDMTPETGKDLGARGAERQAGGVMDKLVGKIEELAGDLTGNERWQAEGKAKQMEGGVKQELGGADERLDEAADDQTH